MSAAVSHDSANASALARDLLRRALSAFASVGPEDRGPALASIDGFLEAPSPATYLSAARALFDARRTQALRQLRTSQAGHAFARGLEAVRRELGVAAAQTLAAVPGDERAGLRLRALALLSAAHIELAERVAGRAELLRKQLALSTQKSTPAPPRHRPPAAKRRRAPRRRPASA